MQNSNKSGLTTFAQSAATLSDASRGSAWVATQLRRAIQEGRYAHGEKLPAERKFATVFRASRATIRTALVRLESEHLVTRRLGSGTFVNSRAHSASDSFADLTGPLELIDVRLGIEPTMVRLAVLNATARDIERIANAVGRIDRASRNAESFTLCDKEFHQLICEATRNPLLLWIYQQINEVRSHPQWSKMKDKVLTPTRIAAYNQQHKAIFEAISSRDVERATSLITAHLNAARRQLLGANGSDE